MILYFRPQTLLLFRKKDEFNFVRFFNNDNEIYQAEATAQIAFS